MSETTNFGQASLVVRGVTPSGPSMNVTSIRVSNTVLSFDSATGSITANVYDANGTLVRLSRVPIQIQSASQPASVGPGDEWVCSSNANVFKYTSTIGWGWLGTYAAAALYSFTSATFNTGGLTGRYGPTLSQARSGLTGTPAPSGWSGTYLNMTTQGYQVWTVPVTGTYTVDAYGSGTSGGGNGGRVQAQFSLTSGEVLIIAVGHQGIVGDGAGNWYAGGGGGGSFVARGSAQASATVLLVAGGGGGRYYTGGVLANGQSPGGWTTDTVSTTASGGTGSGNGGGAGAGVDGNGYSSGGGGGTVAFSFRSTLIGDSGNTTYGNAHGGFGGGGSGGGNPGGGGGGYRGGNYGTGASGTNAYDVAGQGGTNYINSIGTSTTSLGGVNSGAGYVTITSGVVVAPSLYTFTTATFNTGGANGRYGPTLSQARSGLAGTPAPSTWYSTYLDMSTQGISKWTVPVTGSYTITAKGSSEYDYQNDGPTVGIGAALITGTFTLISGNIVNIVVGQQAGGVGGSGGSFVFLSNGTLLIAAGGSGSTSSSGGTSLPTGNALLTVGNGPNGGAGGPGYLSGPNGSAGGPGYAGDAGAGGTPNANSMGGSGGAGGWSSSSNFIGGYGESLGAFGLGSGSGFHGNTNWGSAGGAGGGYGGGNGGAAYGPGYGGSSYNSGTSQSASLSSTVSGSAGYVTITKI
jgi:hypothetical protein